MCNTSLKFQSQECSCVIGVNYCSHSLVSHIVDVVKGLLHEKNSMAETMGPALYATAPRYANSNLSEYSTLYKVKSLNRLYQPST